MSDEAVKLASEWLAQNERQHADPDAYDNCITIGDERDMLTLARAVIAQAEELAELRAALTEALDMAGELRCPGVVDDSALARIAELRRLADGE